MDRVFGKHAGTRHHMRASIFAYLLKKRVQQPCLSLQLSCSSAEPGTSCAPMCDWFSMPIHVQERLAQMDEEDIEDVDEDYILASRLEAGLFTLQQSALIMANLWFYNDVNLRKRILLLLHQQARFFLLLSI